MFSVVTPNTWVSPRLNNAEPCVLGRMLISADKSRNCTGVLPSIRILSRNTLSRITFLETEPKAALISFSRSGNFSVNATKTSAFASSSTVCLSTLPPICIALETA